MKTLPLLLVGLLATAPLFAQDNQLKNPGFEAKDPDKPGQAAGWDQFTETGEPASVECIADSAQSGSQSMKLGFENNKNGFVGIAQGVPVAPGEKFTFSAFAKDAGVKGKTCLKLGLEWKDPAGKEISRDSSSEFNASNLSPTEWKKIEVTASAPPKAATVTVTFTVLTGGESGGALLIDSANLEKVK